MKTKKIVSLLLTIVMMLGLSSVFVTAEDSPAYYDSVEHVTDQSFSDTINGIVDETKWGTPNATFTPSHLVNSSTRPANWTHVNITTNKYLIDGQSVYKNQSVKLYVRYAEEGIYLAVKFINAIERDQAVAGTSWIKRAGLDVSIGTYDETYNVKRDANNKELFRTYRLMEDYNAANNSYTAVVAYPNQNGVAQSGAKLNSYAIGFENQTYIYECIIPFDNTYILKDHDVVLSLAVRDAYVEKSNKPGDTTTFSLSNVFNISDVCRATTRQGGTADQRAYPFYYCNPLRIHIDERCYVNNKLSGMPGQAPKADGNVSTEEYGAPVIITSPEHAKDTWTRGYAVGKNATKNNDQRTKVYMTNDGEYLYVAATMDYAQESTNPNATNAYQPLLAVTVSQYVDGGVYKVDGKEQFRFFRVYLKNGTMGIWSRRYNDNADAGGVAVTSDCYYAKYDKATQTYTFELKIAWNTIPGMTEGIRTASPIGVTVRVGEANLGTTNAHENSYYQIGGTAAGSLGQSAPHSKGVLKMDINPAVAEDPYVSDVASAGQAITVDGKISQAEWGAAVAVLAPTNKDFFNGDKEHNAPDQRAKVYLSNDDKYIYVGATLDRSDKGVAYAGSGSWKYPLFWFTLSAWDEDTTVKRVNATEQFTSYRFNFAEPSICKTYSQNISGDVALKAEDWKVVYDEATRTYTYEARIPLSVTNIRYADSLDVAFSAQVGASLFAANKENDRYNLGMAPANYPVQEHRHEGKGRAVKVTLNKPSWLVEGNYVRDTVAQKQGDITIDANVSAAEWGEPVIVTAPTFAKGYWNPNGYWRKEMVHADQLAKVYMTNDTEYLYVAATLDHSDANVNVDALSYGQPLMAITLSKYDPDSNVAIVNGKEQFSYYRIGWNQGGEVKATVSARQLNKFSLSDSDWAVRYDAEAKTYTYELRIPLSTTNINIHETSQIAASIQIGDSNYGTNGNENNRYNIGGSGVANWHLASTDGNYPHANQPALVMNLRQDYYVSDKASQVSDAVAMDGKITVAEWGTPILVANPSYTHTSIGAYREYDVKATDDGQTARMWLSNDNDYIYVGATLDKSWMQTATKNKDGQDLTVTMRPHFAFDLSQYDEANTFKQVENALEQYTGFVIWLDENGKEQISVRTQGLEAKALSADDYAVSFNEKTGMYTYEMRIPMSMTNIDVVSDTRIAFSASLGTNYSGRGAQANRYLFSLGCEGPQGEGNLSHKDNALVLILQEVPYAKDAMAPFVGPITLDGYVSGDEYGKPIIVTNPAHCKATWSFWRNDVANVIDDQVVKVYGTNDEDNLYFAVTVNETELCTLDALMYEKAHMYLTVGRYDENTDMERITSRDKTYERCIIYRLGFDGTTPKVLANGIKVDRVSIAEDDWAIRYDAQARTYTYELRVPIAGTTLRYGNDNKMCVSIAVSDAKHSTEKAANVYNIGGTGASYAGPQANNFAHTDKSMMLKLNDNRYTKANNWTPSVEPNPVTGDFPIWMAIILLVTSGCLAVYAIVKRKA